MEIQVKGHSGCHIDIVRDGTGLYISKSTRDPKYLSRLVLQADKQRRAMNEEYRHIRVPKVYEVKRNGHEVDVRMEYVYSRNFIEYFEAAGFEQIKYFIQALILFVERELQSSPMQKIPGYVVMDKFADVENKIMTNPLLVCDREMRNIMKHSRQTFESLTGGVEMPVGVCHGDLTFSNILFNGNNYYLIDFLDSFIESPLLDIVKIRQDSAHLWSQLMYTGQYDKVRLAIVCRKIDNEIDAYFSRYNWYTHLYHPFQLMNLLRILQYGKEHRVIDYLKVELNKMLAL